ncbi:hypothetical protein ACQKL5_11360 [Peribacillus sp. NPDC097675]|uniref:hypothetical protein n=1 Tax=Peribacillus sp. NPDC097675 TaxID=3390618 RepID=UPI003D076570
MYKHISLPLILLCLFVLPSCSSHEYQDALDKGIESLGKRDYHQAAIQFELALKKKNGDEDASSYLEQANYMDEAVSAYEEKEYGASLESLNTVIANKGTLKTLQTEAEKLKAEVLADQETASSFEDTMKVVKELMAKENYSVARKKLRLLEKRLESEDSLSSYQPELAKLTKQVDLASKEQEVTQPEVKKTLEKSDEQRDSYQLYENGRYGFSMYYPKGLRMDPPPTNGDGARFFNDQFEITAYASHTNVINDEETIEMYYENDLNSITEEIAYQRITEDWYVLSYEENGKIIYKKFYFNDQVGTTFVISYPASEQEKYGPITSHIAETFTPSTNS